MKTRLALATAVVLTLTSLTAWIPGTAASAALPLGAFGAGIAPPVHHGTLRVAGVPRDGATVTAAFGASRIAAASTPISAPRPSSTAPSSCRPPCWAARST